MHGNIVDEFPRPSAPHFSPHALSLSLKHFLFHLQTSYPEVQYSIDGAFLTSVICAPPCLCHSVYQLLVALLALQRCLTSLRMLMEDRQKMQGKCITLTAQSTGPIEGRSITSNSHVKQAHFQLQLLPGWVLILQILHICRRRVSSLSYVFHTSLNISKALALPLPHTITSSQMSCIWGSCASSSKK